MTADVSGVIDELNDVRLTTGHHLPRVFRDWTALAVASFARDNERYTGRLDCYATLEDDEAERREVAEAFSRDDDHYDPDAHELVVTDLIDEWLRVLDTDGVLLADTDAWLFSQLLPYLHETLGDGCVRTGDVVALASDGTPDCSTPGQYGASGGYSYVVASPSACPVDAPFRTPAPRQREQYGWGTVKPLKPYRAWVREFTAPGDRILVPCAGTAPTAIAAELEHGAAADVLAVDVEADAKAAYERRRADELDRQATLNAGWS